MSDAGPETLVGLLAEESRLKVVAAVVLGAGREPDIVTATGLAARTVHTALDRLVRGGIVVTTPLGNMRVAVERFKEAAQRAAAERPQRRPEELGATADQAQVLRNYLVDGRLTHIPTNRSKRLVVLDFLAGAGGQLRDGSFLPRLRRPAPLPGGGRAPRAAGRFLLALRRYF